MKYTIQELQFAATVSDRAAALRAQAKAVAKQERRSSLQPLPQAPPVAYSDADRALQAALDVAESAHRMTEDEFLQRWNAVNPLHGFIEPALRELEALAAIISSTVTK